MTWIDDWRAAHWHASHRRPLDLPARFANAHPAKLPRESLRGLVNKYVMNFEGYAAQGVAPALFGPTATWKSYATALCCIWAAEVELLEADFVACADRFPALELRRFAPDTARVLDVWRDTPFLALDDFATVRPNSWAADQMQALLAYRFDHLLPTMVNANLQGDVQAEVEARFGASVARRVWHGRDGLRLTISQ